MSALWAELRRRNVFRVGVAYLALAWVVIQVTDLAVPALNLPESLYSIVFYIGMVGFPFAIFFAWAFELTPDGLKREKEVDRSESVTHATARKLDFAIIGMLVLAIVFLVFDNYLIGSSGDTISVTDPLADAVEEQQVYDSIGVLPFTNMSNDPDQEYFSDGMAEELLNALAKLQNLRVAARTSSFAFKGQKLDITEIGNTLKVDTVLEGSVRKSGTRLRITAQLIDVANGYHLWSETYDRELTDIFAIQDELTAAIVDALKVHLTIGETIERADNIDNWEAYDAYLKGLHAISRRTDKSTAAAITHFEQAVRLEPDFAAALAQQAQAVLLSVAYGGTPKAEAAAIGDRLINRALELNPKLAEAYAARGYLSMEARNCEQALPDFEKALALNSDLVEALHWSSLCLKRAGRLREALQLEQRAHQLDPLHASVFTGLYDFRFEYGMDVDLNLEAAQRNNPERFMDYRFSLLIYQKNWAGLVELSAERPDLQTAIFTEVVGTTLLAQENAALSARLVEQSKTPNHDVYLFSLNAFEHFERAQQHLAGLTDSDLSWGGHDGWLGSISYLSGALAEAETLLARSLGGDFDHVLPPSFLLSRLNLTISLADTLQRRGREEAAAALIDEARGTIENLKRNGALAGYHFPEARLSILEGDPVAALSLLQTADSTGTLDWLMLNDPIIRRLSGNLEFITFKVGYDQHLNAERAKLGWPPIVFR